MSDYITDKVVTMETTFSLQVYRSVQVCWRYIEERQLSIENVLGEGRGGEGGGGGDNFCCGHIQDVICTELPSHLPSEVCM